MKGRSAIFLLKSCVLVFLGCVYTALLLWCHPEFCCLCGVVLCAVALYVNGYTTGGRWCDVNTCGNFSGLSAFSSVQVERDCSNRYEAMND